MSEDQEQTRLLQQMLEALQRSGGDTNSKEVKAAKKNLSDYNLALKRGSRAEEDRTDVVGKSAAMMNKAVVGTSKFVAATAAAAGAVRENREDFNSLNPAIQLVGNGMQMASKTVGALGDAAGDALKGIPFIGPALGGVTSAAAKMTAALGQAAGEIVKTIGPMLTAELQRAATAFRTAGSVAALGEDGLTGLANQAISTGLSFNTFSKVVAENAAVMTNAVANSAEAAQMLANTGKEMQPFRRGLMALGISVEQQTELTANYIGLQQRLNRNQTGDARSLAQGSKNYIQQLTELSKLTGKSVSEQQKELEAQTRHVRMGATMREVERKLGAEAGATAVKNIQGTAAILEKAAPTLAAGFKDALGGNFKSEAGKNFYRATGEAGKEILANLKAGNMTSVQAMAALQEAATQRYNKLGGDKFAMAAGNTGTAVEGILVDLQSLSFGPKFADQIGKIETATEKNMKTTDATTNSMIDAQESMIKAAKALDELALQTSLPLAATAISEFTTYSVKASKKMLAYADAFAKGGVGAVTNKLKEDAINKNVGDAGSALDKQDATNFNAGGLLMKADITVAKGIEGLVGFFSEGAKDFLKEMRVENQTNYLENQGIKVKRDDYAATLAGPKSNVQKSDINKSVSTNLATTANARKQIDDEYNKLQSTPSAGNDNTNVVSEQQTTNKLLKRLVQQNQ